MGKERRWWWKRKKDKEAIKRGHMVHPAGGMGKERQGQDPTEQRTQTGKGRQGHHFLPAIPPITKRWWKRKKDKEAINLSVKLAEKPEVKQPQQYQWRGDTRSYGADKAEPVTGYPAGPYGMAKAETLTIYPETGASSHPRPYPPLHNQQHNPSLYQSQAGYRPPPPPPNQGYQHPRPYPQDYNIGPPNQGYQHFVPPYPQGYYPPPNQSHQLAPPYNRPPNQGHQTLPPPYSQVYHRPPNQGYQLLPPPHSQSYLPPPAPFPGLSTLPAYFVKRVGNALIDDGVKTIITNGIGGYDGGYDGGYNDGNDDGVYGDGGSDGGSSF